MQSLKPTSPSCMTFAYCSWPLNCIFYSRLFAAYVFSFIRSLSRWPFRKRASSLPASIFKMISCYSHLPAGQPFPTIFSIRDSSNHRFIWAPMYSCIHWLRPCNSPSIWAHIRGRYWSAKIDDISL